MSDKTFTVFATMAETDESYVTHVEAPDPHEAWRRALREAPGVIRRAGVVSGRVEDVSDDEPEVTPLHGHEATVTTTAVRVVERQIVLPSTCPSCRRDLQEPSGITSTDLIHRIWRGHLSHDGSAVRAERDQEIRDLRLTAAHSARLSCSVCGHAVWDGIRRQ